MKLRDKLRTLVALLLVVASANARERQPGVPVVCGYAAHSATDSIEPRYVNRIIYSHMSVDSTLTKVELRNPDRLEYIAGLRSRQPALEVMVSFGGSPGQLSQAMRNDSLRTLVVTDIMRVVDRYGLDGVDVDWEFPGRGDGALSEKDDVANYIKLLSDLRHALGDSRVLTIACAGSGYGVDYTAMAEIIDQFNVMCYDMGTPPSHHSALYDSDRVSWLSVDRSIRNFLNGGVTPDKIVLGMPFYGRGIAPYDNFVEWRHITTAPNCTVEFDEVARVPWIADPSGHMVLTYDNADSLKEKCEFIRHNRLAGAMYWRIEQDDHHHTLSRTVHDTLISH